MATAGEVNPAVLRRTQELLGPYVKKPVLSEKLLRKPPYRFLHDVVNAVRDFQIPWPCFHSNTMILVFSLYSQVIQGTGYLGAVFSADELVYENVKEKDAKIEFLQKLIDAVSE